MTKKLIREIIFKARKKAFDNASTNAGMQSLIDVVSNLESKQVIAGYMPIRTEISPLAAMNKLSNSGKSICVPVVQSAGEPLLFKEWTPNSNMLVGPFGAEIPEHGEFLEPEVLIVPLVAFDRKGARVGYGGGFYDRYISTIMNDKKIIKIGLGFSFQKIDKVPINKYDKKLDYIITEKNFI
jgi:5-formyltetrahydrofolate cyclo-ligase